MKDVRKTKNIYFTIIGVVIFMVAVVSLSYAFFISQVSNNETASTITGEAANLTIEFKEGTSQINATNIFPGWSATKTFSVINKGGVAGEYSLYLYDVSNNLLDESISIELTSTNNGASISKMNLPSTTTTLNSKVTIAGNTTQVYTLNVYYNNLNVSQETDKGKNFSFKIGINKAGYTITNLIANGGFENGTNGWSSTITSTPTNTLGDHTSVYNSTWLDDGGSHSACFVKSWSYDYDFNNIYQQFTAIVGHKYYVSSNVLIDSSYYNYSNDTLYLSIYNSSLTVDGESALTVSSADTNISFAGPYWSNTYYSKKYSFIYTPTTTTQTMTIGLKSNVTSATAYVSKSEYKTSFLSLNDGDIIAVPDTFDFLTDNILVIDLTATFGAGNEPTQAWCDENITWFDGTSALDVTL